MAPVCGLVGAYLIYDLATARETPSTALFALQLVLIAGCVVGLVGALAKLKG